MWLSVHGASYSQMISRWLSEVQLSEIVRASHVCCAPEVSLGFPASPAAPGRKKGTWESEKLLFFQISSSFILRHIVSYSFIMFHFFFTAVVCQWDILSNWNMLRTCDMMCTMCAHGSMCGPCWLQPVLAWRSLSWPCLSVLPLPKNPGLLEASPGMLSHLRGATACHNKPGETKKKQRRNEEEYRTKSNQMSRTSIHMTRVFFAFLVTLL